jgi:hypothetical protein
MVRDRARMVRALESADSLLCPPDSPNLMHQTVHGQGADGPQPDREFFIPFSVFENKFQQGFLAQIYTFLSIQWLVYMHSYIINLSYESFAYTVFPSWNENKLSKIGDRYHKKDILEIKSNGTHVYSTSSNIGEINYIHFTSQFAKPCFI